MFGHSGQEAAVSEAIGPLMEVPVVASARAEECKFSLHADELDFEDGFVCACA